MEHHGKSANSCGFFWRFSEETISKKVEEPTSLKNDGLRQIGSSSQLLENFFQIHVPKHQNRFFFGTMEPEKKIRCCTGFSSCSAGPSHNGNPSNGYINPCEWIDDHPLSQVKIKDGHQYSLTWPWLY